MTSTKAMAGLLVGGLIAAGLVAGAGTGAAADQVRVDKTLTFTCPFPLIGLQVLKTRIQATFTLPAAPGDSVKTSDFKTTATVPSTATVGLREVGATSLEGTADAAVSVATSAGTLPIKLKGLTVAKTAIPDGTAFDMAVTGSVPEFAPDEGHVSVTMKDYTAFVVPKKTDGSFTGIGDIISPCTLDAGQNAELLSFDVGAPPSTTTPPPAGVKYAYNLKGVSKLKNLAGDVPISGTIDATLTLATKKFVADLKLNPTTANLTIMGFLPVVTKVAFENTAQTTGSIDDQGVLRSNSKLTIALPQVNLFGFPISQSPDCKTTTPSDINLASAADFDVIAGGKLTGSYAIAPLKGCGAFNDYISGFAAADGNKLDLNLTAR
ncbi:hypothetical protein [Alloactinosynnema sp. L-07]|uniref:DUF6801 domain-containing protein n=1 Tax=Alloactinosynnema sp. L-07 TaxID=1653480 RepID=UPI00065F0233|nr:DUF6801 domain-containing protein [Alloactinosynnema sp. L-07]CRK57247.1 hypothetical protein [Alloactinosynnema sp. L-07]